jgi:hypothetical protein
MNESGGAQAAPSAPGRTSEPSSAPTSPTAPRLNAEHAQALRDALARYAGAARRIGGGARRPARSGRKASASGLNTTEVREWAKAQGLDVKDRGRVPAELVVKFKGGYQ